DLAGFMDRNDVGMVQSAGSARLAEKTLAHGGGNGRRQGRNLKRYISGQQRGIGLINNAPAAAAHPAPPLKTPQLRPRQWDGRPRFVVVWLGRHFRSIAVYILAGVQLPQPQTIKEPEPL